MGAENKGLVVRLPSDFHALTHEERHLRMFALILEGCCPNCRLPLERRRACGWCNRCRFGWAARTLSEDRQPFWASEKLVMKYTDRAEETFPCVDEASGA